MPPKKVKTWAENAQGLMNDHGITFKGPTQPKKWPKEHKHLFQVIRDIWAVRFDDYKSDKLTRRALRERQRTAREIAEQAHRLRYDRTNEATWRGLERKVVQLFEQKAVCDCGKELYTFEHEAEPQASDEQARVRRKRQRRRRCTCDDDVFAITESDSRSDDSDKAQPVIFSNAESTAITHHPDDNLEQTDIPMAPDRTIGLSVPPQLKHALRASSHRLSHCPLQNETSILYPFLLVEAKREAEAPRFADIEAQTSFPLRRLLMLQDSLRKESETIFEPLVWFFAYRGEEWRLYAGTLKGENVNVHDLWHGTIESLDGSLQILQIIDYLWTWARDIYRPQIRRALRALSSNIGRLMSPATDGTPSRSQSVLSEVQIRPPRAAQIDVMMEENQQNGSVPRQRPALSATQRDDPAMSEIGSHLTTNQQLNPPETRIGSADFVHLSFHVINYSQHIFDPEFVQRTPGSQSACEWLKKSLRSNSILVLEHDQVKGLERLWSGQVAAPASTGMTVHQPFGWGFVHIYCRTFCRQGDWRIVRELNCVFWDLGVVDMRVLDELCNEFLQLRDTAQRRGQYTNLNETVSEVRNMTGKWSVTAALNNLTFTLSNVTSTDLDSASLYWMKGNPPHTDHFDDGALGLRSTFLSLHESAYDAVIRRGDPGEALKSLIPISEEMGRVDGILAKKPNSWPAQCPKFYLFVVQNVELTDQRRLRQILFDVLRERAIYGAVDEGSAAEELYLTPEDRQLIREWLQSLGN